MTAAQPATGQQPAKQINDLIARFDTAMLVTESRQRELRGRPMAIAGYGDRSQLYFYTRGEDEKLHEMVQRPDVCVLMQREDQYLSLSGRARFDTDPALKEKLWSASGRLWFPAGPDDPDLSLLCIEPTFAECWDRSGLNKLEFWWQAGKAILKREKAADDELSGHQKLKL